jgi:hypothetical protein
VGICALNRSEHPVRWTAAELEEQDGSRPALLHRPPADPLIAAHDSLDTWATQAELEAAGLDLGIPLVAIMRLAAGDEFRSAPLTLAPE